ncbi:MAG: hypothetical protein GX901_06605, partial [Lentisphaerae bacterium]|nr:hypothetical protein [Lentisphaerota bacterium]
WWFCFNDYVSNEKSFICPADTNKKCDNALATTEPLAYTKFSEGLSYGYNGRSGVGYMVISKAARPSKTLMVADVGSTTANKTSSYVTSVTPTLSEGVNQVSARHGGGQNIVMADGHVEDIRCTYTSSAQTAAQNLYRSDFVQLVWESSLPNPSDDSDGYTK